MEEEEGVKGWNLMEPDGTDEYFDNEEFHS
jgi:hypothetical protein